MPGVFLNEDDYNFDIALRRFKNGKRSLLTWMMVNYQ